MNTIYFLLGIIILLIIISNFRIKPVGFCFSLNKPFLFIKNKINNLIIFSLSIFALVTFLVPNMVSATSGACSSHGGVNCSISNSYKSVVCNDGSSDSYTSYYDLQECKTTTTCDNGQVTAFSASRGLSGSSFGQSASSNCDSVNNSQTTNVNIITPTYSSSTKWKEDYCINTYGPNTIYNSEKDACRCITGYMMDSSKVCLPEKEVLTKIYTKHLNEEVLIYMPEYKDIVDVSKIVEMGLDPENSHKTFRQMIIETYGDKLKAKEEVIPEVIVKEVVTPKSVKIDNKKSLPDLSKTTSVVSSEISKNIPDNKPVVVDEIKQEIKRPSFMRSATNKTVTLFQGFLTSIKKVFVINNSIN